MNGRAGARQHHIFSLLSFKEIKIKQVLINSIICGCFYVPLYFCIYLISLSFYDYDYFYMYTDDVVIYLMHFYKRSKGPSELAPRAACARVESWEKMSIKEKWVVVRQSWSGLIWQDEALNGRIKERGARDVTTTTRSSLSDCGGGAHPPTPLMSLPCHTVCHFHPATHL
jgi:hypothetical protein